MQTIILRQINEEFEMKLISLRLIEKKLLKDIEILTQYYKLKRNQKSASNILSLIKQRKTSLHDTQSAIIEFQQNLIYFQKRS